MPTCLWMPYLIALRSMGAVRIAATRFAAKTAGNLPEVRRTRVTSQANDIRQAGTLSVSGVTWSSVAVLPEQVANAR